MISIIIGIVICVLAIWILLKFNAMFFKRLQVKYNGLHLLFFKRLVDVGIILACTIITISSFIGLESIWQTILGGTAITTAVLTFVAQDSIKDVLGGLMISLNKPFEIGNRIALDDGTIGIVEDMTPRHVVLKGVDTLRYIVPNSKLNTMRIVNYSYHREDRSIAFRFSVGYDSDMSLVKKVIAKEIEDSPFTKPKIKEEDGTEVYAPVLFMEFANSALIMGVTVYYDSSKPTERVTDDVNTRVREALIANNIEIPYPYITVTEAKDKSENNLISSKPGRDLQVNLQEERS
jgi:small-conductance mechanosensitive channel